MEITSSNFRNKKTRLNILQLMRFIAAFGVIICHNSFYTFERLNSSGHIYREGGNGVPLFFVISGFVMFISSQNLGDTANSWKIFSLRRLVRIVPLYWFVTSVKVIALVFAAHLLLHTQFNLSHIIKSYFFIPSVNIDGDIKPLFAIGWTLIFEMFFYMVFAAALYLKINTITFSALVMVPLSVASMFKTDAWPTIIYFLADPVVLNFVMGTIAAKLYLSDFRLPLPYTIIGISIGAFVLFIPSDLRHSIFDIFGSPTIVKGIGSFLIVISVVSLEERWGSYIPRSFLFLGAASYSLYLIHPLVGPIIPTVLENFLPLASNGLGWFWFSVFLGSIMSIIVGSVAYLTLESPITARLNKKIVNFS